MSSNPSDPFTLWLSKLDSMSSDLQTEQREVGLAGSGMDNLKSWFTDSMPAQLTNKHHSDGDLIKSLQKLTARTFDPVEPMSKSNSNSWPWPSQQDHDAREQPVFVEQPNSWRTPDPTPRYSAREHRSEEVLKTSRSLHSAFNSKLNSRDDITILSGERFVESLDLPKSARSPSKSVDLEGIKNQVRKLSSHLSPQTRSYENGPMTPSSQQQLCRDITPGMRNGELWHQDLQKRLENLLSPLNSWK
ncbi:hypothetical protein GUITHDRAFT_118534 [Guillardia theta CCMP2712]|uniref:Uncharacterized protein n=1 Tax=Guillardia theta (strain CCMP2712) TaxID=905079 RepID=L1IHM9_GUITC|nr:hypothetical protein GUITHDRAFT_118534 [Guillardia theta CCMP2712]EKX35300.1 hypothetical protein GUITHDRAFT_118534 [Guillardia theta CCMP2712]|eukprot:XP_005822280.1 hypothetical protein GUITHDRAFT_118534 [Guillardia theta CCMP2712]